MTTPKIIVAILQMIASIIIIAVVLLQSGRDQGMGVITGGAETFFGKNKGKTIEAKLSKWTAIVAALFIILTVALNAMEFLQK